MTDKAKNVDPRDSGRWAIATLIAVWLVFWGLMGLGCVFGMADAKTLGSWCLSFFGFFGCLYMFADGLHFTTKFVTGRDVEESKSR